MAHDECKGKAQVTMLTQGGLLHAGAIKDSIVAEEALVRHMLWELANQPQFAGWGQHPVLACL